MGRKKGLGEKIISLRKNGKTYNEIVEILKCSKNTVNYHCVKHGLTDIGFKNVKVSAETSKAIYDFVNNGEGTPEEASKKFDLHITTIARHSKNKLFEE